ncbi:hypothetical protein JAAARDRAFT_89043, partial [Jaapia argillacea MUCL 33604]
TGACSHMMPHCHWFVGYSAHIVPIRLANNAIIQLVGLGSVEFQLVVDGEKMHPGIFHNVL